MSSEGASARLRALFAGELEEHVARIGADLLALEAASGDAEALRSLFRSAHTLKGAGHAAGVRVVEEACHSMEALLADARDGVLRLGAGELSLLLAAADGLAEVGDRLKGGAPLEGCALETLLPALRGARRAARRGEAPPTQPAEARAADPADATPAVPLPEARGPVRVEPHKLDALLSVTGQLFEAGEQLSSRAGGGAALEEAVAQAEAECARLLHRLRRGDGAGGAAAAERLQAVLRTAAEAARHGRTDAERDARAVSRVAEELGHRVRQLRMRPFSDVGEALPRLVREVAARTGREVALRVEGGEVHADRVVWAAVREAVMHLVRNAVDHGIEPPDARVRQGKPRVGTVAVAARLRGDRIVVTVADDGAGVDAAAVRRSIAARGRTPPASDRELARAMLRGGITTRAEATEISGRGVGLDSARAALERIRGSVEVEWQAGEGTTFTLECPPAMLTLRALLAVAGGHLVALPTAQVERLSRVDPGELRRVEGRDVLPDAETPVPLVSLARLIDPAAEPASPGGALRVIRLRAGGGRLAVQVDDWLDEQELLVRPLKGVREPPAHLTGAAILGSGRVALVLNPVALVEAGHAAGGSAAAATVPTAAPQRRPRILVVDDSITTRTLEQSVLEAAGYAVATAVDGADGWRILQEEGCDLVVSDVEMPRMDGFALCRAIRSAKRFRELPVILVTALETPEHRAEGLEAGADAYLAKSSFDQARLLDIIAQMVG